jgi:hypothetical protein
MEPSRLVVVDPDSEYDGFGPITDRPSDVLAAMALPYYHIRFRPHYSVDLARAQFAKICQLVRWQCAPEAHEPRPTRIAPVVLCVDELSSLVGPYRRESPLEWQWLVTRGRKHGVWIFAASTRPELIDKTLFSACSVLRVHRCNDPEASTRLAKALNVPAAEVLSLQGRGFIARDKDSGRRFDG